MSLIQRGNAPSSDQPIATFSEIPLYNECYTGVCAEEARVADCDYSAEREKALNHNSKQGIKPMTKEELEFERSISWELVKKMTMSIFKLDFSNMSFPVGYNEQRTFLERCADLFSFLVTEYADKAYETSDAQMRLSYITTGILASFHLCLQSKKPWNPTLGETYVGEWPNGTKIYGEQISHHPAISYIQIRPENHNHWKIDSEFRFGINQGVTRIDICQEGISKLIFDDGCVYEWEFPRVRVLGILAGDRILKMKGELKVTDRHNNLEMKVEFNPKKSKKMGISSSRASTLYGEIRRLGKAEHDDGVLSQMRGDYAESISINNRVSWNLSTNFSSRPIKKVDESLLLPSDSRYRFDRNCLIEGDLKKAEEAKTIIERLQRKDNALRK